MIKVSELAAMVLVESLEASCVGSGKGLRLKPEGKELALQLDSPGNNDRIIWHNGAIALIVDKETEAKIGDAIIDVEDDPDEPYLALRKNIPKENN
jgi:hypothetical protein